MGASDHNESTAPVDQQRSSDLFLSYNTRDREYVLRVQQMLCTRGIATFLDCQHLTVGLSWRDEIEAALNKVNAVAVFIGSDGFGRVQRGEKNLALDRQEFATKAGQRFPVIPILLPGAQPDAVTGFLSQNTWIDLRASLDNAAALDAIARAIRGGVPVVQTAAPEPLCPYRGLLAFTEDDAPLFYGRDAFSDALLEKARRLKLLAVIGPSGTGKSSVVQAGLLPRLRRERAPHAQWETVIFRPGNRPFHNLADELVALYETSLSKTDQMLAANKLGEALAKNELPLDVPVAEALKATKWANRLLIIADQFEELFTLTEEKDRKPFVQLLLKAAETAPLTLVLTLRGDFYNQAISVSRELSDLLQQGIVNIGYVKREELRRAILEPAKTVGLQFEDSLVERILDNLEDEPGNLPLLEFALTELWEKRQGNRVSNQLYEEIGGVGGSLGKRAEEVFASLLPVQQDLAIRAFTRLVRVAAASEEGTDSRQRVNLKDFDPPSQIILQKFVKTRLLVTNRNHVTNEEIVELAHEALIKNWHRLQEALNRDREFLSWRRRLNFRLDEWEKSKRDEEELLKGNFLQEAKQWLVERPTDLNQYEQDYITWAEKDDFQIEKILSQAQPLVAYCEEGAGIWCYTLVICIGWEGALSAIKTIKSKTIYVESLCDIANLMARAGHNEHVSYLANEALKALQEINDPHYSEDRLPEIIEAMAKGGLTDQAISIALNIKNEYARHVSIQTIATELAAAKQADHALDLISEIKDSQTYKSALLHIATAMCEVGLHKEAFGLIKNDNSVQLSSRRFSEIAMALSKAGLTKDANHFAKQAVTIADNSSESLYAAESLADGGFIEQASQIISKTLSVSQVGAFRLYSGLYINADVIVRTGFARQAISLAQSIQDYEYRFRVFAKIAWELAKKGKIEEAFDLAHEIKWTGQRIITFARIAVALASSGHTEEAMKVCENVRCGIGGVADDEERSEGYAGLAIAQAKLQKYYLARLDAERCARSIDKLAAFAAILREFSVARNPDLIRFFRPRKGHYIGTLQLLME
ncbi:MAG: TIR domain-containing protein [Blastocatellia bacterium]